MLNISDRQSCYINRPDIFKGVRSFSPFAEFNRLGEIKVGWTDGWILEATVEIATNEKKKKGRLEIGEEDDGLAHLERERRQKQQVHKLSESVLRLLRLGLELKSMEFRGTEERNKKKEPRRSMIRDKRHTRSWTSSFKLTSRVSCQILELKLFYNDRVIVLCGLFPLLVAAMRRSFFFFKVDIVSSLSFVSASERGTKRQ